MEAWPAHLHARLASFNFVGVLAAMRRLYLALPRLFATCLTLVVSTAFGQATEKPLDFNRDVQPILAKNCYQCHGPNDAEGGLRLNSQEASRAVLESGLKAIVPGKPDESELLRRVTSTDHSERMPPEGKGLSAAQVDTLKRWIASGAEWEQYWAFRPVVKPAVPEVTDKSWAKGPIDAFILAQLEAANLKPAPAADKVTLLRRITYDLTGLPPTWAEWEAFRDDNSPEAYEKLVDRLLASKHYGEHWARKWLDVVRYAETNSFERDNPKPHVWRYRDYVINAFNDDIPYTQFIREQLAGDELDNPTPESLIATGYYRLGLWDDEPADRELARFDELDDLVATTSQAFLGLTINCARCHDHKIDPLPQKDYYAMAAFFSNIRPMQTRGDHIEQVLFRTDADRQNYQNELENLQKQRDEFQARVAESEAKFRAALAAKNGEGKPDSSDLDSLRYSYYRESWDNLPDFAMFKAERSGDVPSKRFDISIADRPDAFGFVFEGTLNVPVDGQYTFHLDSDDGSRLIVDGKELIKYDGIHGEGTVQKIEVALTQGQKPIKLEYFQRGGGRGLTMSWKGPNFDFRPLSATPDKQERIDIEQVINTQGESLLGRDAVREYRRLKREQNELRGRQVPADYALTITEYGHRGREMFLLERGNPQSPGPLVAPGFPGVLDSSVPAMPELPESAKTSGRRRILADWIASDKNLLTARVMVNRVWQHHFGRGIVRSPNNFGGLGTPPTHPQLLDWLAADLMEHDWRLKRLHKSMVMSNVYQMSSRPSADALEKDPANDLFSRFDMRRLGAEEVRDTLLATSGTLNTKMLGPSIYPEISAEVLAGQSVPGAGWQKSSPEEASRRSVYIHVKRSLLTPLLSAFDLPDPDFSCDSRFSTTQPAQSLAMLNGKFTGDMATAFAQRIAKEAGDDPKQRIAAAYRIALCREPSEVEIDRHLKLIDTLEKEHAQSKESAWRLFCLTVLNLNEYLYLD